MTSRRTLRPVYLSCGVSVVLLLVSVAADQLSSVAYSVVWALFLFSFALVPLSFLAGVLRSRLDRSSAARMLVSLDAGIPLRDALAQALHDPSLEIVYWLETQGSWVDELGHEVDEPARLPERSVTTIERGGQRIAALVHDPSLDDEPELVELIAAGAGLPLENVRLQADLRSQFLFLETVANTAPSLLVVIDSRAGSEPEPGDARRRAASSDEETDRGRYFWEVFIDEDDRSGLRRGFVTQHPTSPRRQYENSLHERRGRATRDRVAERSRHGCVGTVSSIVAGGIDITERKQREVQLQRERDITRHAHAGHPEPRRRGRQQRDHRRQRRRRDAGRGQQRVPERARLAGQPSCDGACSTFVDPADGQVALEAITAAANGEAVPEQESSWLRADGEGLAVAWTATPIDDVTGRTASLVLLSGVDVTERKQTRARDQGLPVEDHRGRGRCASRPRAQPARRRPAAPRLSVAVAPPRRIQGGDGSGEQRARSSTPRARSLPRRSTSFVSSPAASTLRY